MRQPYGPIQIQSSKAPRSKAIFTDRSTFRVGFLQIFDSILQMKVATRLSDERPTKFQTQSSDSSKRRAAGQPKF